MIETNRSRRALVICSNYGVEQDELFVPIDELHRAGVDVTVAAPVSDPVQTLVDDKEPGRTLEAGTTIAESVANDYDILVIPGGTINADSLRLDSDAVAMVKQFADSGRTIAAICHGPWMAVEADVVRDKTLTSYPSLKTDIRNANAASWLDEPVVTDAKHGYILITSRNPDDLPDFTKAIGEVLELP